METRARHQPWHEPSEPATAHPGWILLDPYFEGCDDPDARTVAHARTSKGRPISVSLVLAGPPALSSLRLHAHGLPKGVNIRPGAVAAHRDSLLLSIRTRSDGWNDDDVFAYDYFIYRAGGAAAQPSRPPSLSVLPPLYHAYQEEGDPKETRSLHERATAILRRGQDEVLVAELQSCGIVNREESSGAVAAELGLLRSSGNWHWELKWLPVIHGEGKREEISFWWTDCAVPLGDRLVLWVDYFRGIIYSDDVWDETPKLRYVSLPVEPVNRMTLDHYGSNYRTVCATNDGWAVRFVEVSPHCSCRCPTATACAVSCSFTITTWDLRMDDMTTWDKVGAINCDKLWSIPSYHGVVPRIKPTYPIVSVDDPDVLSFMVEKTTYGMAVGSDVGKWLIKLHTRRLEIRSISYYGCEFDFYPPFLVSAVSRYFDTSSCSHTLSRREDTDLEAPARPLELTLSKVAPHGEMLSTVQELRT